MSAGLGGYLLSRVGWWARWEPQAFVLYDVTLVIASLLRCPDSGGRWGNAAAARRP